MQELSQPSGKLPIQANRFRKVRIALAINTDLIYYRNAIYGLVSAGEISMKADDAYRRLVTNRWQVDR